MGKINWNQDLSLEFIVSVQDEVVQKHPEKTKYISFYLKEIIILQRSIAKIEMNLRILAMTDSGTRAQDKNRIYFQYYLKPAQ